MDARITTTASFNVDDDDKDYSSASGNLDDEIDPIGALSDGSICMYYNVFLLVSHSSSSLRNKENNDKTFKPVPGREGGSGIVAITVLQHIVVGFDII